MPKNYLVHDTTANTYTECPNKASAMSLVARLEKLDKYDGFFRPHRYVIIVNKYSFGLRRSRYEE